jgi:hypothetical protein
MNTSARTHGNHAIAALYCGDDGFIGSLGTLTETIN